MLETILDAPQYQFTRATSASEALFALISGEFALLILDVRMPEISGLELAALVKQRKRSAHTPIIFLTAYDMDEQHMLAGYDTGAVDYLHKPVNAAVLRSKVAVFVELHRRGLELEERNRQLAAEIAERKRTEEELATLNAHLEGRVKERTEKLRSSEERLLTLNRRKDEFLATLAHELRNPLAPLSSGVRLLIERGIPDPQMLSTCAMMDRQIRAMGRLLEDLMDVRRVDDGRIELQVEPVCMRQVLTEAVETVQPLIEAAGQVLHMDDATVPLPVLGDRTRLVQVVVNVLTNAAKYTDAGGNVDLRAEVLEESVVVRIKDTGIGLAPQRLEAIFEMFSQEEPALSRSRGGLGIGLSLTRKLVELHGGTISAHSAGIGAGSEFTIRLPLSSNVQGAPNQSVAMPSSDGPKGGLRILIADDNGDAAESLGTLLEMEGHAVQLAQDGQTAVSLAASLDPHLVILDIGMPILNGYEVCRRLRAQEGGLERTILAVTGWGQAHDVNAALEAGFDFHFVKPINLESLIAVVAKRAGQLPAQEDRAPAKATRPGSEGR